MALRHPHPAFPFSKRRQVCETALLPRPERRLAEKSACGERMQPLADVPANPVTASDGMIADPRRHCCAACWTKRLPLARPEALPSGVALADLEADLEAETGAHPEGRTVVLGAGKAAAAMARAVEDIPGRTAPSKGWLSRATAMPCRAGRSASIEAAHPVPDRAGEDAARQILALAARGRAGRSAPVPAVRRRLRPAQPAGARPDAGRQAGRDPRPARGGRRYPRDQFGAQASVGDQGRAARCRRRAGAAGDPRHFGRRRETIRRPSGPGRPFPTRQAWPMPARFCAASESRRPVRWRQRSKTRQTRP